MNHQVIFRSSIRRMRHVHVAIKQKDLCRLFASTTRGTPNNNNNNTINSGDIKNGMLATPFVSVAAGTAPSRIGNGSSFSAGIGGDNISIGSRSTTLSKKPTGFVGKSSFSNSAGSSTSNDDGGSSGPEFRNVYVHPLSQIVLEYLQDSHHEWVVATGLDGSLTLHRDGSFELKHVCVHVPQSHASTSMSTATSLSSSTTHNKKNEPHISTSTSKTAAMKQEKNKADASDSDVAAKGSSKAQHQQKQQHYQQTSAAASTTTTDNKNNKSNNIRIWTSYDEQEKKHWLTVRRGLFRQRFLLQDNLLTAWQGNRGVSIAERLHVAVDEMIRAVNRVDRQQQQQAPTIGQQQQQQWHQKGQRRFRKR